MPKSIIALSPKSKEFFPQLLYMEKGLAAPSCVLKPARPLLEASNAHVSRAPAGGSNARERSVGQIQDATTVVRTVVCDAYHDAAAIALVGHPHASAEGKGAMGSSEAVSIEALTTGSTLSVKAITHSIPTAGSTSRIGFGLLVGEGNEQ